MIKEYIGSLDDRHNLTKYTLTNGVEVTLNEQEEEELFRGTKYSNDMLDKIYYLNTENNDLELSVSELTNQIEVLETRLEKYKEVIRTYKDFQELLSKVKV